MFLIVSKEKVFLFMTSKQCSSVKAMFSNDHSCPSVGRSVSKSFAVDQSVCAKGREVTL